MRLNKHFNGKWVGPVGALALVGILAYGTICPAQEEVSADSQSWNVEFTVNSYVELKTQPSNITMTSVTPTADGVATTGKTTFKFASNSTSNATVKVSTTGQLNGTGGATATLNGPNSNTINPISASSGTLTKDTWGVYVGASEIAGTGTFYKPSTSGTDFAVAPSLFGTDLVLECGANVSTAKTAGDYTQTLTISVTVPAV